MVKIITILVVSLLFSLAFFLGSFTYESALMGLIIGFFFSVASYLFRNSKRIKNQTALREERLFKQETIVNSFFANLIIRPADFNLKSFSFDEYFKYFGMKNQEALGGSLHLTNFRLIFKTHRYNRIRGEFSVFLSEIKNIEIISSLLHKKMIINTTASSLTVIVDQPQKIKDSILQTQSQLGEIEKEQLKIAVKENPEKCIDSTEAWKIVNNINELLLLKNKADNITGVFQSPVNAIATFYYNEFTEKFILCNHDKNQE